MQSECWGSGEEWISHNLSTRTVPQPWSDEGRTTEPDSGPPRVQNLLPRHPRNSCQRNDRGKVRRMQWYNRECGITWGILLPILQISHIHVNFLYIIPGPLNTPWMRWRTFQLTKWTCLLQINAPELDTKISGSIWSNVSDFPRNDAGIYEQALLLPASQLAL